jgi:hypothetical protein
MPIHDNKGRNPVPDLGDASGYYPDGKPPEPTQAEIDAFKAAMEEEISSKVDGISETHKPVEHLNRAGPVKPAIAIPDSKIKPFFPESETDARIPEGNPYAFPVTRSAESAPLELPVSKEGDGDGVDFLIGKADRKRAVEMDDGSGSVPEAVMQAGALYRLHTGEDPFQAAFQLQAPEQHGHTTPLTQEVVSMVDRMLVTADSGSYVKEVRMSMNDSVLPNVEIQFRQVGNSLTVTLINEGGESLEMLRKEAPELAEALRARTGDEVEVKIVTGVGAGASEETV